MLWMSIGIVSQDFIRRTKYDDSLENSWHRDEKNGTMGQRCNFVTSYKIFKATFVTVTSYH